MFVTVGIMNMRGIGTEVNKEEALRWFVKGREEGSLIGSMLADEIERGNGDTARRYGEYCRLSEEGDAHGMFMRGLCEHSGQGTEPNFRSGMEWYEKSAGKGSAEGQCAIGWAYLHGEIVAMDEEKGIEWLTKSAEQGNTTAQNILEQLN